MKENYVFQSRFTCYDIPLDYSSNFNIIIEYFVSICPYFDRVADSIVEERGYFEDKTLLLQLKSKWANILNSIMIHMTDEFLISAWLYVSGCISKSYISSDELAEDISTIIQSFITEEILVVDFVEQMIQHGFRRPFSRLVAYYLSSNEYRLTFAEIIEGLSTPLRLNSFLVCQENVASYCSYIKSDEDGSEIQATDPSQCFLTATGSPDWSPLRPLSYTPKEDFKPRDYGSYLYEQCKILLQSKEGHMIIGHVTSEQVVIDMCLHQNVYDTPRGMSINAASTNASSCGSGMYFFRLSEIGNFETLACSGGSPNDKVCVEFQSFMYALTRAFQSTKKCHRLSPAVLLFLVPVNFFEDFVENKNKSPSLS